MVDGGWENAASLRKVTLRRFVLAAMAILALAAIFLLATLPPRPAVVPLDGLDPHLLRRTVSGAYHVHTLRSDGAGDKAAIAAAAARAGLRFVIFTDHGDGTRAGDPPAYLDGVLCIDGVEISTNDGHYVALGMQAPPYPLGGDAAAVVEDVRRLGGFGVAAHPDHPKAQLAWTDRNTAIDGIEWINADSEWRNEPPLRIARVLFDYFVRPAPALASVFDRPVETLAWWDRILQSRSVVALAAVDAHGGSRDSAREEGGARYGVGPSYEASFRTVTNRVLLDSPFTGDAASDARALLAAVRKGRLYTVVDAVSPSVVIDGTGLAARIVSAPPAGAIAEPRGSHAGRRWQEIQHPQAPGRPPVPWVLVNPIWQDAAAAAAEPPVAPPGDLLKLESPWRVEKDPQSSGVVNASAGAVAIGYSLAGGDRASQFVAAAVDLDPEARLDTLTFRGRAARPMRVSVQLRVRPDDARWRRSIYLDTEDRQITVAVGEMRSAERVGAVPPVSVHARSLLFVVDLTNARPGDAGSFTVTDVRISARSPEAPR